MRKDHLVQSRSVNIGLLPFLLVDIDGVLLDDVQEVSVGDAHEDLLDLLLGVEPS